MIPFVIPDGGFFFLVGTPPSIDPPPPPPPPPPLPATTTAQAIKVFWSSGTLPSLTSDGLLWYGEAPNQPITPYAVLVLVSEPETARTTSFALFEGTYQINCMHDSLVGAEAMAETVWNTFNNAQLKRNGQPVLFCLSGMQHSMLGHELGIDGKDCWVSFVEIQILFIK